MKRKDLFFGLARNFVEWDGWDAEERDSKVALGHRLAGARGTLHSAGEDWRSDVAGVLRDPTNNIIASRDGETLAKWLEGEGPEETVKPFEALWEPGAKSERWRISDFLSLVPLKAARTKGVRLNVATFLIGGCGVESNPPLRSPLYDEAWTVLGYPKPKKGSDAAAIYDQALRNFDRLCEHAAERRLELRDRLDAQGLVWSLMQWSEDNPFIQTWSDEDRTRLGQLRGV